MGAGVPRGAAATIYNVPGGGAGELIDATSPVTEIRVGSTPRRLNRETGEWQEAPASYYTVKCWRRLAINAASSLHKGDTVIIRGRFYTNTWVDSQQQTRTKLEIEAIRARRCALCCAPESAYQRVPTQAPSNIVVATAHRAPMRSAGVGYGASGGSLFEAGVD